jgi:phosphoglycolate phosphatase-like HAD superfamily hydrolase
MNIIMTPFKKILTKNVIGTLCVSADDGQKLHDLILENIKYDRPVEVSFAGVDTLISAFLNASIGQLYGEFDEETIDKYVQISDMEADDFELLHRVIDNAKVYFQNRRSFDDAWSSQDDDQE